ncbi:MAG: hypothetical protein AAGD38_18980, partial [Acidobacteriota bacterium]
MTTARITITLDSDHSPQFGKQASIGSGNPVSSVSGTEKPISGDATSINWALDADSKSAFGGTYILAIVLADQGGDSLGPDPGSYLEAASGNFFLHEAGWSLPDDSKAGTAYVAVPPPSGCTLDIRNENP